MFKRSVGCALANEARQSCSPRLEVASDLAASSDGKIVICLPGDIRQWSNPANHTPAVLIASICDGAWRTRVPFQLDCNCQSCCARVAAARVAIATQAESS